MPPRFSSFAKKWWVDNRERLEEWYRIYFHTISVTLLLIVNLWLGFSSFLLFFAQWYHVDSGPVGFLSLFLKNPNPHGPLTNLFNLFYVPLDHHMAVWILLVLNLPLFNWLYSTTTQPIMRGYSTIISWTSKRGRIAAAILSGIPFFCSFTAVFAWYVRHYLFDFFTSVKSDKEYLVVHSMESFGYVLMCVPIFISLFSVYLIAKEFYRNEDIQKMFFKWEFPLLASQSFSLRGKSCDVIVGWEKDTNKPIVLKENSRYLHELIVGATGTGKTSTAILIRIIQDLIRIARGRRMGVVVLEPKGDLIRDVQKLCAKLGIQGDKIKIVDPTDLVRSIKFNPFLGPLEAAAETFRGVLDALAGDQDEFFKGQQNETASLYTMLGKIRYGNIFSIVQMQQMYSDPRYLANITEEVRVALDKELSDTDLPPEKKILFERYDRVVAYFENDVLEYKTFRDKEGNVNPVVYQSGHKYEGQQVVDNKKDKFVTGAKKYLNDIVMNAMLSQLMVANDGEEALDIDRFLQEGGVLLVNTALGELEELSLSFGQFFIRQFQSSVFRRPPDESGVKRCPIFFNIDEFPLYINEAFVRLLTLGRSFKVGTLIAIQSLGQLKVVVPGYDNTVMNSARNKTVFGGGEFEDNERFSQNFGEEHHVEESMNESTTPVSMPNQSWGMRYNTQRKLEARFTPTDIKEQPFKHFIVDLVDGDGSVQAPVEAYGKFITETKFIKKFVNIGQIEFETKNHKPLAIAAHKLVHFNLLRPLFAESVKEEDIQKTSQVEEVQEDKAPIEMLPTSPVQDDEEELPLNGTAIVPLESQNGMEQQRGYTPDPVFSEQTRVQTPVDVSSHPYEEVQRLVAVDDEEESPLDQTMPVGQRQPITLSPEEEESYEFYNDSTRSFPADSGNSEYDGVLSVIDDDPSLHPVSTDNTMDHVEDSIRLPNAMEASLNTLFNQLDKPTSVEQSIHHDSDSSKGGWDLADITTDSNQGVQVVGPTNIPTNQPTKKRETISPAQGAESTEIDRDLIDLVAENKKSGRSIQQEIANSRITVLHDTVEED
ncbi:conjugation protein, TraG/TraD family [Paenibacillus oralis]|uniref:Conjugation protein, TraG/TraD family n=2 Tax=Paenibacillus oralis TaxID=2490856 RepID=A0A3P3TAQ1_9BACL|nr:conjugation protein, TraG/TraD family [Paenibacillus oralis]